MGVWWAISSDFMDTIPKCEYFFAAVEFFSVRMLAGGDGGRFAAGMSVDICDHISRFHRNTTYSHTHIPLSQREYVGARARCVRLIRTYEKYHKHILPMFLSFFCIPSYFTIRSHTTSLQNIRLKHALNISTRNLRQSTHWNLTASLCGSQSVTTERGAKRANKKIRRDIELTIKQ